MRTTEIELTKYGELALLTYEWTYTKACAPYERDELEIIPLTLQRYSEESGELLPSENAEDLEVTDHIRQELWTEITRVLQQYA